MSSSDEILQPRNSDTLPIATQFSQVIRAGLPLETGLHALAEQTKSHRTRVALLELSQRLERGEPLEEAVTKAESGLNRQMKTLIVAGLECGRLDSTLQYGIDQAQRTASLRTQIWLGLSYPIFLFWFSTLICGFILTVVVPQLGSVFNDLDVNTPLMTSGLLSVSGFFSKFTWLPWFILIAGGLAGLAAIISAGLFGWGRRWATSLPLIGRSFRLASLMDFCQILSLLTESGLPFSRALHFAGEASDDPWLTRKCDRMIKSLQEGATAEEAAIKIQFPSTLCQAFRGVSSSSAFVDSMRGLADIFAAQSQVTLTVANGMIAQLAIYVVLGCAGFIGGILFATLIHLLRSMTG
ncbi:type II secretion system F family protein [Schlesneria paludicola]|uniref:type II secretion system F family protein n=1 Tax=Schlesneria paludicola TaxID=360056 RepID=UPI00029A6061|nr:type II secretion system F family protein [Schlesneria paludicola]